MEGQNEELKRIIPTGRLVTIAGERLLIKPFRARQFALVFEQAAQLMERGALTSLDGKITEANILPLLLRGGTVILEILTLASDKPAAWVDELEQPDLVRLALAVYQENADFFVKEVLPLLPADLIENAGRVAQAGRPGRKPSRP